MREALVQRLTAHVLRQMSAPTTHTNESAPDQNEKQVTVRTVARRHIHQRRLHFWPFRCEDPSARTSRACTSRSAASVRERVHPNLRFMPLTIATLSPVAVEKGGASPHLSNQRAHGWLRGKSRVQHGSGWGHRAVWPGSQRPVSRCASSSTAPELRKDTSRPGPSRVWGLMSTVRQFAEHATDTRA